MRTDLVCGPGLAWVVACALAGACGGGDMTGTDGRVSGGGAGTPGTGDMAAAGTTATGGDGDFGNTDLTMVPGSELSDAGTAGGDAGCGSTSVEAEQVVLQMEVVHEMIVETPKPVALYIMLDQSASMQTSGLWDPAKVALKSFFDDMASTGLEVALDVFPPLFPDPGDCTGAGYDAPKVPIGALPGNAAALKGALDAMPTATGIGTPIEGALRGVTKFCLDFEAANPDKDCVAVLVTDGAPFGCAGDAPTLTGIVASALGSGVPTFAVGLQGADFNLLDQIAMTGGAMDCDDAAPTFACDVSAGPAKLVDALSKIRDVIQTVETTTEIVTTVEDTPLECEWTIPEPPQGMSFDRDAVNVQLSAPSLAMPLALGHVASEDACKAKGWRYDDNDAPTRIVACPETCELLQSTPLAKIDILLGCKTVPLM